MIKMTVNPVKEIIFSLLLATNPNISSVGFYNSGLSLLNEKQNL